MAGPKPRTFVRDYRKRYRRARAFPPTVPPTVAMRPPDS